MVGVGAAARMLPFFLVGLVSGAIADRWDRRVLVQLGTLGASVVASAMRCCCWADWRRCGW